MRALFGALKISDTRLILTTDDSRASCMMAKGISQQKYPDATIFEVGNVEENLALDIPRAYRMIFKGIIFHAFSQVDTSNTKNIAGTGLNLVTSKDIIGNHRDSINFDSSTSNDIYFYFKITEY